MTDGGFSTPGADGRAPSTPHHAGSRLTRTASGKTPSSPREVKTIRYAELEHRCKNLITIAQSIMRNALREASCLEEGLETAERRLRNLDGVNRLLTMSAVHETTMAAMCAEALSPFRDDGAGLRLNGGHVTLPGQIAFALALTLHELATNASKYGSLSVPHGELDLSWSTFRTSAGEDRLLLIWSEHNGPEAGEPRREGFGSRLVDRMLGSFLCEPLRRSWHPQGLVCTMALRLSPKPRPIRADEIHPC